ncbi:hypothetical protein F6B41_19650 [Microbacterium lushaniae]|nr:hypothetical protein F6B41_26850 [Microbacterium lushaniae]KAA9151809.1 hypothetical protein F6B41_19650 [Microbacterium lushaniae]
MNLSRDHRVVPQFHLKRFADAQRRARQLSDGDGARPLIPVKRATVGDGCYNIETRTGEEHDGWEKMFGL